MVYLLLFNGHVIYRHHILPIQVQWPLYGSQMVMSKLLILTITQSKLQQHLICLSPSPLPHQSQLANLSLQSPHWLLSSICHHQTLFLFKHCGDGHWLQMNIIHMFSSICISQGLSIYSDSKNFDKSNPVQTSMGNPPERHSMQIIWVTILRARGKFQATRHYPCCACLLDILAAYAHQYFRFKWGGMTGSISAW